MGFFEAFFGEYGMFGLGFFPLVLAVPAALWLRVFRKNISSFLVLTAASFIYIGLFIFIVVFISSRSGAGNSWVFDILIFPISFPISLVFIWICLKLESTNPDIRWIVPAFLGVLVLGHGVHASWQANIRKILKDSAEQGFDPSQCTKLLSSDDSGSYGSVDSENCYKNAANTSRNPKVCLGNKDTLAKISCLQATQSKIGGFEACKLAEEVLNDPKARIPDDGEKFFLGAIRLGIGDCFHAAAVPQETNKFCERSVARNDFASIVGAKCYLIEGMKQNRVIVNALEWYLAEPRRTLFMRRKYSWAPTREELEPYLR